MAENIRIGLVGAGENTRAKHIPGFRKIDGVELLGVVNRCRTSSQTVADAFGIPKVYDDWTELIADPEIDAVCIGTWPYMHCPVTLAALEAGKHVLCEARMAMNADEALRMRDAAKACPDLVTQLVPSPFMQGPDAAIYQSLRDGVIGDVLAVDLRFCAPTFMNREAPLNWRQDAESSGLNALALGILYEAGMRWVGAARTVQAVAKINVTQRKDPGGVAHAIQIPDHIEVIGELESGASYHITCSAVCGMGPANTGWIFGSEGTLQADFAAKKIRLGTRGDDALTDITPVESTWQGWRVEEEFIGAIRGEEEVKFTTFDDGVAYMEFTEAVVHSQRDGSRLELPLS